VPYERYDETAAEVSAAIAALAPRVAEGLDRTALQGLLPAGAARNALDCALWDLAAKRAGRPVHELAGVAPPAARVTAYTISLGSPNVMAEAAAKAAGRPLLKVKLGEAGDPERIRAVRAAAPGENLAACAAAGVTLVEQPLPAADDAALAAFPHPIPVCADESVHDRATLAGLAGKYDAVNIKLDKTGGLTEALALADAAERMGFALMVGCMISTSLALAPALLVATRARVVDLDGALLLARDRPHGLRYDDARVHPAGPELWG
jgi:L-alanine-DL-glutamate epimerase-like enolase superfamily enzyme